MRLILDDPDCSRRYEVDVPDDASDETLLDAGKQLRRDAYTNEPASRGMAYLAESAEGLVWVTIEDDEDNVRSNPLFRPEERT